MTKCQCTEPGYCSTHRRMMCQIRFNECHAQKGFFEAFQKDLKNKALNDRGIGDSLAKKIDQTGLKQLADFWTKVTGKGCGCQKRQAKLNKWFRYDGKISVGVTTAPRGKVLLQQCVASIVENRWEPRIYAEPKSDLQGLRQLPVIQNEERKGAWLNFVAMCEDLLNNTKSDWILTMQDDTILAKGVSDFLEKWEWQTPDCGMVSLYTPTQYTKTKPGCYKIRTSSLWGACAMLFQRKDLERILETKVSKNWKGAKPKKRTRPREPWEIANVDTAIGKAIREIKKNPYFFTPSFSQHIGAVSSLPGHHGLGPKRSAKKVVTDWSVFDA